MKHLPKLIALAAIALFALAACSNFTYSASDLKSKVITYYVNMMTQSANGHDYSVMTFDSTGKAGTLEVDMYEHGWATTTLAATGDYSTQTWVLAGGFKGTFTYDPDTFTLTATMTNIYTNTTAATYIGNGIYSAFEWVDLDTYFTRMSGYTATGASYTGSMNVRLTADSINPILSAGTVADTWVSKGSYTQGYTANSIAFAGGSTTTTTWTIPSTGTSITKDYVEVTTQTINTTTTTDTYEEITNYSINKAFIVGAEDKTDETFSDIWKKGNAVTLMADRTKYSELEYIGTTVPTAPTVPATSTSATTGTYGTAPYYYIYTGVGTATFNLTNVGTYIIDTSENAFAARHLGAK